jgi:putative ATP-binding cassette transporter
MLATIRHAWKRLLTIARPFRTYDARWWAVGLFGVIIALLLTVNGLNVLNSYVGRDFMNSLQHYHIDQFWRLGLLYVGMFVLVTSVQVMAAWCEQRLDLMLREGLTRHVIHRYMSDRIYYKLTARADIDNPDQRISEDIKNFTQMAVSFALILLNATLALIGFVGVLWAITPRLVGVAILYAVVGSVITIIIGRRLPGLNFLQLKKEADFRFGLIRARENGEAIAMQGSESGEERRLNTRLGALIENFKHVIGVNRNIQFFTVGYNYLTAVIPVFVVAPLYFNGLIEMGGVFQSIAAFTQVLGAFSVIISQFQQISQFAAGAERLGALVEAVDTQPQWVPVNVPHVVEAEDNKQIAFQHLNLKTPDDRELVTDLEYKLPENQRLLISGQNGAGKTALFQAINDMWPSGSGRIVRPPNVMFLSQTPYIPPGPLREQLVEGEGCKPRTDEEILGVLRELRITKTVDRQGGLAADKDWMAVLSPGELRLLAFARLVLAEPPFAFLDVGVSGLDDFWVGLLYGALSRRRTVYVSIGEHAGLRKFHDRELVLVGQGAWMEGECKEAAAG